MTDLVLPAKSALRERIRAKMKKLTAEEMTAASARICARLAQQKIWRQSKAILFFAPLADEPDIWPLLVTALAAGKTVGLPRFAAGDNFYEACRIRDCARDLSGGRFGIREPREGCSRIALNRLDLILVPGVAFDLEGRRLGRGKGFYDRLLAPYRGPACGVAFDQQIVPEVPAGSHDVHLSYILTPARWHALTGPRAVLK